MCEIRSEEGHNPHAGAALRIESIVHTMVKYSKSSDSLSVVAELPYLLDLVAVKVPIDHQFNDIL